jgi:hypothetical protein
MTFPVKLIVRMIDDDLLVLAAINRCTSWLSHSCLTLCHLSLWNWEYVRNEKWQSVVDGGQV